MIVAAAGNNNGNFVIYPANYTNVIGVSGVQPNKLFADTSPCPIQGGRYASSNYGTHVDLAAPFWALSTVPTNSYADETGGWCGTSMATPHVAGAAALVRAKNPTWTNQQVVNQLTSTALDLGPVGRDDFYGYGLLDAGEALGVLRPPPPPPPSVSIVGPSSVRANASCIWSASVSGTPPYNYHWIKDGGFIGSGPEVTTSFAASGTLWVQVSDAGGGSATASIEITVKPTAPICSF